MSSRMVAVLAGVPGFPGDQLGQPPCKATSWGSVVGNSAAISLTILCSSLLACR